MAGKPFPYNVHVGTSRGAPMGRQGRGQPHGNYMPVTTRRVPIDAQGYDPGGAYWGTRPKGVMLFCMWSAGRAVIRYYDATSYLFAQEAFRKNFPQADFLKG